MLWAWESKTDLRFLKPGEAGVAFHVATVRLEKGDAIPWLRRQPLLVAPGVFRMPVVRISGYGPQWTALQRAKTAQMIQEAVELTGADAVQIDFDAPVSARTFYRALIEDVRRRLGPRVFLSMTALVSWCEADSWMRGLPVDEIVPMAFHMGQETESMQLLLSRGAPFGYAGCRTAIGVSRNAPLPLLRSAPRVYAFPDSPNISGAWTIESISRIRSKLE